jgi:hypothetical protein
MKPLIVFTTFLLLGLAVAVAIGFYVERLTSSNVSLLVFLCLFFANYGVAWIGTVLVMDGSLRGERGARTEPTQQPGARARV